MTKALSLVLHQGPPPIELRRLIGLMRPEGAAILDQLSERIAPDAPATSERYRSVG